MQKLDHSQLSMPIIFGKKRAVIVGASWDSKRQRAYIVYRDETGAERTTRATDMSRRSLRQAILDEMTHERWGQ